MTEQPKTEVQLRLLQQFVKDQPAARGWELVDLGAPFARAQARITDSFAWTLDLKPRADGQWAAVCADHSREDQVEGVDFFMRIGTWDECTTWLGRRESVAQRLRERASNLAVFAGRPSWRYVERGQRDHPFAQRLFEFPEVSGGEKVALFLRLNDIRRAPFSGQVQMPFSAGPEESVADDLGPVTVWLKDWEQTLTVPQKLRDCSDLDEAERLAERTEWKHVQRLVYLFNLSPNMAPGAARRAVARLFAPTD